MGNNDAKEQTQGKRTIQSRTFSSSDTGCSRGSDKTSEPTGIESVSSAGKDWQGGDSIKPFVCGTFGKILDRLIDSWEDRKQEAKDCLTWYNGQIDRCDNEIELLKSIKNDLVQASTEEE